MLMWSRRRPFGAREARQLEQALKARADLPTASVTPLKDTHIQTPGPLSFIKKKREREKENDIVPGDYSRWREGRGGAGRGTTPSASSRCARHTRTSPRGHAAINARSVAAEVQRSGCSGLSSGGATAYRAKASLHAASRQTAALLCHAATGHSRGRARRTSERPRDAERTVVPFRILGLWPRLRTLKCPNGLSGPAGLPRRHQDPGTTALYLPACGLQGGRCAPLGTDPPGRLQDKRGAAALKLSPCHAKHLRAELWLEYYYPLRQVQPSLS